jgi:hypothetical protein
MDWSDLLTGLALYLVLEGILPFLAPEGWRRSVVLLAGLQGRQLRFFGLASMLAGVALLVFVRNGT